jgi:hypothetical protein
MAGLGTKLWTSGEVVTAAGVNGYLQDQVIGTYASTTARDAAFGGVGEPTLSEGMFAYTTDTNTLWLYSGATNGWVNVLGSDIGQQALSNRNVIINGAMQIAQRGTSVASITTTGYYTADRISTTVSSMGTWTQSVETDAPTGSGFRNSVKMLCTTADASPAAGDLVSIHQYLEGQNVQQFLKGTASAKQFSVSFWVKSNVTGTYILELFDYNNTRQVSASYTVSASATWEKKTITFPADTTGAFTNNNGASLGCNFWLGAGTTYTSGTLNTTWAANTNANRVVGQTNLASAINNYWQVTGVQLEAGAVATPFEFEDYEVTLAKCQRYGYAVRQITADSALGSGFAFSSTGALIYISLPVTMRAAPTVTYTTLTALAVYNSVGIPQSTTNLTGANHSADTLYVITTCAAALTAGNGTSAIAIGGSSFVLFASAEL